MVIVDAQKPPPGSDNHFIRSRVEPGPPPRKSAVGDDVVLTARHEAQILVGRKSAIVIDKHCPGIEPQVLLNEGNIVRKYKEGRINKPFLDERNGVRVVLLLQNNLAFHGNSRVSPAHVE